MAAPGSQPAASEPKSWAESLQRYSADKAAVPAIENFVAGRRYRDPRFSQMQRDRAFDPLAGLYRDPAQEASVRSTEAKQTVDAMNKARNNALRYEAKHDIISNQSKIVESEQPKRAPPPPPQPEPSRKNRDPEQRTRQKRQHDKTAVEQREFDIISNRQFRDHETWAAQAETVNRAKLAEKFWKQNKFDPVKGTLYNPDDEKRFLEQKEENRKAAGRRRFQRLPHSIQHSEGVLYNITSMQPRMADELQAVERNVKAVRARRKGVKYTFETETRAKDEARTEHKLLQRMNKVSMSRFVPEVKRGYDILTNQTYFGRDSQVPPPPRIVTTPSKWVKFVGDDDNQPQRKNGKGHVDRPALLKAQLFAQGGRPASAPVADGASQVTQQQQQQADGFASARASGDAAAAAKQPLPDSLFAAAVSSPGAAAAAAEPVRFVDGNRVVSDVSGTSNGSSSALQGDGTVAPLADQQRRQQMRSELFGASQSLAAEPPARVSLSRGGQAAASAASAAAPAPAAAAAAGGGRRLRDALGQTSQLNTIAEVTGSLEVSGPLQAAPVSAAKPAVAAAAAPAAAEPLPAYLAPIKLSRPPSRAAAAAAPAAAAPAAAQKAASRPVTAQAAPVAVAPASVAGVRSRRGQGAAVAM